MGRLVSDKSQSFFNLCLILITPPPKPGWVLMAAWTGSHFDGPCKKWFQILGLSPINQIWMKAYIFTVNPTPHWRLGSSNHIPPYPAVHGNENEVNIIICHGLEFYISWGGSWLKRYLTWPDNIKVGPYNISFVGHFPWLFMQILVRSQ